MAPVIWGLDLAEFKWGRFKSGYMFGNKDYHLRRTKFVVYQLAMIFCVVSESLGTAALSDYLDQQDFIQRLNNRAVEYNDDYVGIGSYNIFFGVYNAFIFGAAFFFDLQWPERKEIPGVRLAWKITSVLACVFGLGDLIALTIITSSREAYVTGVPYDLGQQYLREAGGYNPVYRHNGRAVAALVFLWLGYPFVIYSTIIMWLSLSYTSKYGPFSSHVREKSATANHTSTSNHTLSSDEENAYPLSHLDGASSPPGYHQSSATPVTQTTPAATSGMDEVVRYAEEARVSASGRPDGTYRPPMEAGKGGVYAGT